MQFTLPKLVRKTVKITLFSVVVILLVMFLLPILFPDTVSKKIKQWTNQSINGELNFSKARLSFFNHFPALTLTLYDFSLKGSKPFEKDTLIASKELSLGINLKSVFAKSIRISEIYVSNGDINIQVTKDGVPNYNVYKADTTHQIKNPSDTGSASLNLEHIQIDNTNLVYDDRSIPILITAKGFNYSGKGDLSKAIFDLASSVMIDSFDLDYNKSHYIGSKKLKANLITKINTNSLAFIFEKNDLVLNHLPFQFNGQFSFLKDGYDMDFKMSSENADLYDVLSALPPEYTPWFAKIDAGGKTELTASLKGKYIAAQKEAPDFNLGMKVRNGYLDYDKAPSTLKNVYVDFSTALPKLNTDSLQVNLDSLYFDMGKTYLTSSFHLKGLKNMFIQSKLKSELDLAKLSRGMGLQTVQMNGLLFTDVTASGMINYKNKILPVIDAKISLKNGWVQTKYYPAPIEKINVDATIQNHNGSLKDLSINVLPVSFVFEGQPFQMQMNLKDFSNIQYNISSSGTLNVGNIYKVFAVKGYDVKGFIKADFALKGLQADAVKGKYSKLSNSGTLLVKDLALRSYLFPQPLIINSGAFHFNQDRMVFDEFTAKYGTSDITLNGSLSNVINYALQPDVKLKGQFNLFSNHINVDEFMAFADTSSKKTSSTGVVVIPDNVSLSFIAKANEVLYNGIKLTQLKGQMIVDSSKMQLKQSGFTIVGAPVVMDIMYKSITPVKAVFDYHIIAKDFDIHRAYKEIKLFHDMATSAASVKGIASLDYQLSGRLDSNMHPVYLSLKGGGVLSLGKVKIKGMRLMTAVSKATNKDSLNDPDLKEVNIKSKIENNIITIERTKLRIMGFRPRFEGQVSFDGKLNLTGRIGLPPLGIFGIPFSVTGTQSNPVVRLKRGKETDKLEETEDKDQ